MATERLPMRHIREILRQSWFWAGATASGGQAWGISHGSVPNTATRGRALGLDWEAIKALGDEASSSGCMVAKHQARGASVSRPRVPALRAASGRCHVAIAALETRSSIGWLPVPRILRTLQRVVFRGRSQMRQVHRAGETLRRLLGQQAADRRPSDWRGDGGRKLFVRRGSAHRTSPTPKRRARKKVMDFIASHVRALEHIAVFPKRSVPDQSERRQVAPVAMSRTATYVRGMAGHYGTAILPARRAVRGTRPSRKRSTRRPTMDSREDT